MAQPVAQFRWRLLVLLAATVVGHLVLSRAATLDGSELEPETTPKPPGLLEPEATGANSTEEEPEEDDSEGSRASKPKKNKGSRSSSHKCGLAPLNKLGHRKSRSVVGPDDQVAAQVFNGDDEHYGSWPAYVSLGMCSSGGCFSCGGTLVTDRHVLTAAHCTSYNSGRSVYKPHELTVKVGDHSRDRVDQYEARLTVKRVCQSPDFNYIGGGSLPYRDWTILELASPVKLSDHVQPACLAQKMPPTKGSKATCYLVGRGKVREVSKREVEPPSEASEESDTLEVSGATGNSSLDAFESRGSYGSTNKNIVQELRVNQVNCDHRVDQWRICFGGIKPGASCQGDSGGPVLCLNEKNHWTVTGIVSYGAMRCTIQARSSTYASVHGELENMLRACPSLKGHPMI